MASTCSTSLVPMPNASAPNAPCVLVWLSPQTMVMPGWVNAQLGADHMHDALLGRIHIVELDAELAQFLRSVSICLAAIWIERWADACGVVGTLWSTVATVRSGRRTLRPASAQAVERLRRSDLVDQVQIDVEQRRLVVGLADDVRIPKLFKECAWFRHGLLELIQLEHTLLRARKLLTAAVIAERAIRIDIAWLPGAVLLPCCPICSVVSRYLELACAQDPVVRNPDANTSLIAYSMSRASCSSLAV